MKNSSKSGLVGLVLVLVPVDTWTGRTVRLVMRTAALSALLATVAILALYSSIVGLYSGAPAPLPAQRVHFHPQGTHRRPNVRQIQDNLSAIRDTITQKPACKTNATLLIFVTSSPENFERRMAIRDTWCSFYLTVGSRLAKKYQCVFLLGRSNNQDLNIKVHKESQTHGDILRGDYQDTYRNLSQKVMTGFYWASQECQPTYVLKTDDDCFVNIPILLPFLLVQPFDIDILYVGHVFDTKKHRQVVRDPNNRWSVSYDDYAPKHYPRYASGTGYVLSGEVMSRLVSSSHLYTPFPNEDAYVGVILHALNISPAHSYRFALHSTNWSRCNFLYLLVVHHVDAQMQHEMQRTTLEALQECGEKDKPHLTWN